MKERPILFSGLMVRALLDGSKTQTRRACKPANNANLCSVVEVPDPSERGQTYNGSHFGDEEGDVQFACPYGQPGGRLWVRETWYCDDYRVQRAPYLKPADMSVAEAQEDRTLVYRASSGDRPYEAEQPLWRPAIHMPRWASRITLEITGVRVERLQDISEADAIAEGCAKNHNNYYWGGPHKAGGLKQMATARQAYQDLWESINGLGSWEANPWVWVVGFKRVEGGAA